MRLIIAGCEYAGASTLARAIADWSAETLGLSVPIYDMFRVPQIAPFEMTDEEVAQFMALPTLVRQCFQWHSFTSHLMPTVLEQDSYIFVGFQLDEAVYAPLYYGYGRPWEYAEAVGLSRTEESKIMAAVPDIVQVLVKASPEVVSERMNTAPHRHSLLQPTDVAHVLARYEEEAVKKSLIRRKITLDTSNATVAETLAEFVGEMEPHMTSGELELLAAAGQPA